MIRVIIDVNDDSSVHYIEVEINGRIVPIDIKKIQIGSKPVADILGIFIRKALEQAKENNSSV